MQNRSIKKIIPAFLTAWVILLALHLISIPSHNSLWREIANFSHIPLFGFLALIILHLSRLLLGQKIKNQINHWLLTLLIVSVLGTLSELIQILGPRDADWLDLLRDVVGALIFMGIASTLPVKKFPTLGYNLSKIGKLILNISSITLLLMAMLPLIYWSFAFLNRSKQFPMICGFESIWESQFVKSDSGEVKFVPAPSGWQSVYIPSVEGESEIVGEYEFGKVRYPGFYVSEPYPDFRGYDTLSIEIFSALDTIVNLTVRIDDFIHNNKFNDRFNMVFDIQPGMNRLVINCDDIREAPEGREMEMSSVTYIHFFTLTPVQPFTLYFDNLKLD